MGSFSSPVSSTGTLMVSLLDRTPSLPSGTRTRPNNISNAERRISFALGVTLVLAGANRGKLTGLGLAGLGSALLYRGATGYCHGYQLLGINTAQHPPSTVISTKQGCQVECSVTIAQPAADLYAFWRKLDNLPAVLRHLEQVAIIDEQHSRWTAKGPLNIKLTWDAEIINERQNELIAWKSLPGSLVDSAGSVRFTPLSHDRGTVVYVNLRYNPPGGQVSDKLASFFGLDLKSQIEKDLRRFKSLMEAGEAPNVTGQPRGK